MEATQNQKITGTDQPAWLVKSTGLKQVTLDRLAAMPEAQRDIVSPPASWSASGIVEHLILVEECVAGSWREKLIAVPHPKVGAKSALASRMVSFIFARTGMRVPTVAELEPVGGIGIEELELRWAAARKRLIDTLLEDDRAAWVLHPALGPLSSLQMGGMIGSHLEHHLRHWPKPIK